MKLLQYMFLADLLFSFLFSFIVELFLFKMIARNTIQELNLLIQDRELNILSDIFGSIRKIGCKLKNIGANLKVQMSKLLKT